MVALGGLALALCLCAAYRHTLHVPFTFDDDDSISKNPTIRSLATGLFPPTNSGITVSGRPVLNLTFAINYYFGAINPLGYHIGNLLIHLLAALCLFGVVRRTLRLPVLAGKYGAHATPLAWLIAALWALHPLQTESVTYVVQRAESLVSLFYLLTLYLFIRSVERPSRLWPVLACVACCLGMTAKEVMASAPLVIFLYDRTFVSGTFRASWQRHRRLHLSLAAGWLLLGAMLLASGGRGNSVGFGRISWWEYALMQGSAITRYLWLSFVPRDQVFDYGPILEKRPEVLLAGLLVMVPLFAATVYALIKRPLAGFLGAGFFLILAPSSSIIPVTTQTMAEHRMYLSLAAVVTGVVLLCHRTLPRYWWCALLPLVPILGAVTVRRNAVYLTEESIWADVVQKVPVNFRALNNLAATYLVQDRLDEASFRLQQALKIEPDYTVSLSNLGQTMVYQAVKQAGLDRAATGDLVEGVDFKRKNTEANKLLADEKVIGGLALLKKAIQQEPESAGYLARYGSSLLALREPEAALVQLEKAARLDPEDYQSQIGLASVLARMDRDEPAAEHYRTALRLKGDDPELYTNYGALLRRMDRLSESLELLQKAVKMNPRLARAHSNLGVTLLQSGRIPEGMQELSEALRLDPKLPQARYNLSNALADAGRTQEAIVQLEALLKIAPPTAELLSNLGVLYARVGRYEDAVTQTQQALALDPKDEAAQDNLSKILAYLASHPNP